jgi:hypothetical protein
MERLVPKDNAAPFTGAALRSLLHHHVVMVMNHHHVVMMVDHHHVMVMMHRGLCGDREDGDAHGDRGHGEKLLDHVRDFQSRVRPRHRGFMFRLPQRR